MGSHDKETRRGGWGRGSDGCSVLIGWNFRDLISFDLSYVLLFFTKNSGIFARIFGSGFPQILDMVSILEVVGIGAETSQPVLELDVPV